jgi:hypothetical protein
MVDSKFSPGDYVRYENTIYVVKSVIYMNPNILSDPFVCGLVAVGNANSWEQLLVREALLVKVDPPINGKAVKVLYDD